MASSWRCVRCAAERLNSLPAAGGHCGACGTPVSVRIVLTDEYACRGELTTVINRKLRAPRAQGETKWTLPMAFAFHEVFEEDSRWKPFPTRRIKGSTRVAYWTDDMSALEDLCQFHRLRRKQGAPPAWWNIKCFPRGDMAIPVPPAKLIFVERELAGGVGDNAKMWVRQEVTVVLSIVSVTGHIDAKIELPPGYPDVNDRKRWRERPAYAGAVENHFMHHVQQRVRNVRDSSGQLVFHPSVGLAVAAAHGWTCV